MVESRKFLVWSGLFILFVWVLGFSITEWSFPIAATDTVRNIFGFGLGFPSAVLAMAVFIDGLRSVFESRNYVWLWAFVFLAFGGAYLYGFLVASRIENVEDDA
ncbi:MAG: hypothetical protein GXP15_09785 [Gammaproteobacteria bacterium]|nr:hypothetical protein [Gammaproteobacteria bacterium]